MFPYKQESWYRFLLPSQFVVQDKPVIMLAGPSTVRENLRWEQIQEAFPDYHIYQGGNQPWHNRRRNNRSETHRVGVRRRCVAGLCRSWPRPRFLANLPPNRPFKTIVNTYSPWSVATGPDGVELHKKSNVWRCAGQNSFSWQTARAFQVSVASLGGILGPLG